MLLVSFFGGVACSDTYVIVTSLTRIFEEVYQFSEGPVGLTFLGLGIVIASLPVFYKPQSFLIVQRSNTIIGIGMIAGVVICGIILDWYLKRKSTSQDGMKPEYRLPPMIVGGILIPFGFFLFGWTVQARIQWIVPILATSIIGFGFVAIMLAGSSYLVDAFGIHAASALASAAVLRNTMAALVPLAGPPLYTKLGYGWGISVFAFIAIAFAPIPVILMRYGELFRKRSSFQVEL